MIKRTMTHRKPEGSEEYDLFSDIPVRLRRGERKLIPTGIVVNMAKHKGHHAIIKSRYGRKVNFEIDVLATVMDKNYHGEVKVLLVNHAMMPCTVKRGDIIAKMVFVSSADAKS